MSIFKIDSRLKSLIFFALVGFFIVSSVLVVNYFLLAWTEPAAAPPAGGGSMVGGKWSDGAVAGKIYYNGGNVGIGTNDPSALLDVNGKLEAKTLTVYPAGGFDGITIDNSTRSGNLILRGQVDPSFATIWMGAFGANVGQHSFYINLQNPSWQLIFGNVSGGVYRSNLILFSGTEDASVVGDLSVGGDFSVAGTKAFKIDHPTKPGKYLVYASLEGPENGVYVRGEKEDNKVIELPDYWTGLVHEDSITVQLTPVGSRQNLWVEQIKDNKVYINSDSEKIHYFYLIQAERKDLEKLQVEVDK